MHDLHAIDVCTLVHKLYAEHATIHVIPNYNWTTYNIYKAGVVGVVVSSLALHHGDPGSIPEFGIQAVRILPKMEVHTCYSSQKVSTRT